MCCFVSFSPNKYICKSKVITGHVRGHTLGNSVFVIFVSVLYFRLWAVIGTYYHDSSCFAFCPCINLDLYVSMLYVCLESLDLQNYLENSHRKSWSRTKSDQYYKGQILIFFCLKTTLNISSSPSSLK